MDSLGITVVVFLVKFQMMQLLWKTLMSPPMMTENYHVTKKIQVAIQKMYKLKWILVDWCSWGRKAQFSTSKYVCTG